MQLTSTLKRNSIEVRCAFCRGSGKDPFGIMSWLSTCCVCLGRGRVITETPHERCAHCGGTGAVKTFSCTVCRGKGVIPESAGPTEICLHCRGSGDQLSSPAMTCLHCKGRGKIAAAAVPGQAGPRNGQGRQQARISYPESLGMPAAVANIGSIQIVLVDQTGTALGFNKAWDCQENAPWAGENREIAGNYRRNGEEGSALRREVVRGIGAVLAGERDYCVLEYPRRSASGLQWFQLLVTPVEVGSGRVAVVLNHDITGYKLLQEQLCQTRKMEVMGRLVGGVAHDFNNLLTIISGYCEIMLSGLEPEGRWREPIRQIKAAGERAAALTNQLLTFSRKQVLGRVVLDLNATVTDSEKMLRRLMGDDVELVVSLAPELRRIKADQGQIQQVIMNLAVNARDAMPQGGKLIIETANVDLDATQDLGHSKVPPGPFAMLAVTDSGCGMDESTQARIFEPFFTTKEPGRGTGLGLATLCDIVKQSGGHIEVFSKLGCGTIFKVYLPQAEDTKPLDRSSPLPVDSSCQGTETILLVEDDEGVRSLARLVLQSKGYTIVEARNGKQALAIAEQFQEPIDILVTDVVLPGLHGRQLADRLSARRPHMKVLYLSGYTDDALARLHVLEKGMTLLQKPFTPTTLERRVRAVLDAQG